MIEACTATRLPPVRTWFGQQLRGLQYWGKLSSSVTNDHLDTTSPISLPRAATLPLVICGQSEASAYHKTLYCDLLNPPDTLKGPSDDSLRKVAGSRISMPVRIIFQQTFSSLSICVLLVACLAFLFEIEWTSTLYSRLASCTVNSRKLAVFVVLVPNCLIWLCRFTKSKITEVATRLGCSGYNKSAIVGSVHESSGYGWAPLWVFSVVEDNSGLELSVIEPEVHGRKGLLWLDNCNECVITSLETDLTFPEGVRPFCPLHPHRCRAHRLHLVSWESHPWT